ncbi:hypothetical protein BGX29_010597 [Mortierella sp. GBA35]|nr:hypothetical protein BGX29_010597 [Mortierella sp. GBA35]
MEEPGSIQNYGSTLSFSVVCSTFDISESAPNVQTKTRTFDKVSANLGQYGYWHCVFTETKKATRSCVELDLSLAWKLHHDPSAPEHETQTGQQEAASDAKELISRIRSIKMRSDSTLSELLVDQLDGRRIFEGDAIQVKLQSGRVTRNGRYKFRIAFHTQDISRSRFMEHPIFTSFIDIHSDFEPEKYWKDTLPDVCFYFPVSRAVREPISIHAHSAALGESQYFAQRLAEVTEEKATRGSPFYGVLCNITEFTPPVFRTMLRYLYTGRLRPKKADEEAQKRTTSTAAQCESSTTGIAGVYTVGAFETEERRKKRRDEPGAVYFEDLYRISERYEIPTLKALSLKAMQCSLNASVAIAMLSKCRPEAGRGQEEENETQNRNSEAVLNGLQWAMAKDSVKEYIQFFGTEVITSTKDPDPGQDLSIDEHRDMINYLGDTILSNLYRFWE